MPSFEEHCNSSELRTGKRYEELHKWIDEFQKEMGINHREKRHSLNDIDKVRERWGEEGVIEFLVHIIADFKDTKNKLVNKFNEVKQERDGFRDKYVNLIGEYNELFDEAKRIEKGSLLNIPYIVYPKFKKK